jgi:hypothetical protein
MLIQGSCHCRNITFKLHWEPDPLEIPARACTCDFCTKHGGVWTSHPAGVLEVLVGDAGLAARYAFATKTAEFHLCSRCGVVPLVTSRIDGRQYAVVSVNAFDGTGGTPIRKVSATFEGEDESGRLARRQKNWIADVRFNRG